MELVSVFQLIDRLEKAGIPGKARVGRMDYWPLLRCCIFRFYLRPEEKKSRRSFSRNFRAKLSALISSARFIAVNLISLARLRSRRLRKKGDFLIFSFAGNNQYRINEVAYNKFSDSLIAWLGKEHEVISLQQKNAIDDLTIDGEAGGLDYYYLRSRLAKEARSVREFFLFNRQERLHERMIRDVFRGMALMEASSVTMEADFRAELRKFRDSYFFYRNVLRAFKVKKVCLYGYYYPQQMALVTAARTMGLLAIDYQHASQNEYHYAYSGWKLPANGNFDLLPDVFWVYSDKEYRNLNRQFKDSRHKVEVVGNLWMTLWKEKNNGKFSLKDRLGLKERRTALVCFQHFIPPDDNLVWNFVEALIKRNYFIFIRMHPGYKGLRDVLLGKIKNDASVNVDEATDWDLYALLNEIDVCCIFSSTVGEEAMSFNKPVLVFDSLGEHYYESYKNSPLLYIVREPQDVDNWFRVNMR